MTLTAILILILSAVLHASWNFLSKQNRPSAAFMLAANVTGAVALLPIAFAYGRHYSLFPSHVWLLLAATGCFQALYYIFLAGAYRSGDMSLAYPLARSSPVIVVATVTFLLGQGEMISRLCVTGIVLVVLGCFMVPMRHFRDFRLRNYLCRTCAFALLAAVGTAGYSIIDSEALAAIRGNAGDKAGTILITLLYAVAEATSSSIVLAVYVASRRPERRELLNTLRTRLSGASLTGICIYLTYALVLISMSMAKNVSYVVGFRQLSIPLGVFLGVVFLKEPVTPPKAVGVCALVAGLIMIAVG